MHVVKWAAVIVLSVGLGFCFVQYLVASPLRMSAYLLLCVLLVGLLALTVFFGFGGVTPRVLAVGVILAGFVAGYLATTMVFLNQEEQRHLAEVNAAHRRTARPYCGDLLHPRGTACLQPDAVD